MKTRRARIRLILGTAACAFIPLLVVWWRDSHKPPTKPYKFPSAELAALDNVVQRRLAVVPTDDFGFGRVGPRHAYFKPLTEDEKSVITALNASRQDVVFYIVGRAILNGGKGPEEPSSVVQGPIYFTPGAKFRVSKTEPYPLYEWKSSSLPIKWQTQPMERHDLPAEHNIRQLALEAFKAERQENGMNGRFGKWKAAAVTIRASQQACVDCHNAMPRWLPPNENSWFKRPRRDWVKTGDPLGIALYYYQPYPAPKQSMKQK